MRKKKNWDLSEVRDELLGSLPEGWSCPDEAALEQAATLMVKFREERISDDELEHLVALLGKMGMTPAVRGRFVPGDKIN